MAKAKSEAITLPKPVVKASNGKSTSESKLAVIAIRGNVDTSRKVIDTLHMLNLRRKNHCVVIPATLTYKGMVNKVKDYVTWGEIDEQTYKELVAKRGELFQGRASDAKNKYHYRCIEVSGKKYKSVFRLNPPRKGFGRKGIKVAFKAGGALGYRAEKINDLINRML